MKYCNLFDSHTHSDNSHDGNDTISMMCEVVTTKNLSGFCVTDHCECDVPRLNYPPRFQALQFEILKNQAAFRDQLTLLSGIELGQPIYAPQLAEQMLRDFKFDFVLGSLHNNPGQPDFCTMDFTQMTMEEIHGLLQTYFEKLLELARWPHYDALSHLTYPLRYISGIQKIPVDLSPYEELIREILMAVARQGKAIEINTSTLRQGLDVPMPSYEYIKLFRELGGQYVTIGSDAHWARDIGANLQDAMDLLQSVGFRYFTVFRRREPTQLKLL